MFGAVFVLHILLKPLFLLGNIRSLVISFNIQSVVPLSKDQNFGKESRICAQIRSTPVIEVTTG
jgi:hypothetical protein